MAGQKKTGLSGLIIRFVDPLYYALLDRLPNQLQVKIAYFRHFKTWPNITSPQTFNEKIQHRKLYDKNPLYPVFVDKLRVKERVAEIIGREAIIPTLWSGNNPADIPFDSLPAPYVIKANHGSGMDHFVFDSSKVDRDEVVAKASRWLKTDFSKAHREWAYTQVDRQILIEPFIGTGQVSPQDYRFWCFNGRVRMVQIDTDRRLGVRRAFFTPDWVRLDLAMTYPELEEWPRPAVLDEMIEKAEKLATLFDFVRVDFYDNNGHVLFGETTFYPVAGLAHFSPRSMDRKLGEMWV